MADERSLGVRLSPNSYQPPAPPPVTQTKKRPSGTSGAATAAAADAQEAAPKRKTRRRRRRKAGEVNGGLEGAEDEQAAEASDAGMEVDTSVSLGA